MALAPTIAGGAFLGIDSSSKHLKAAVRNGSCDFMVNTLDESLRVLKNELRKQTRYPLACSARHRRSCPPWSSAVSSRILSPTAASEQ